MTFQWIVYLCLIYHMQPNDIILQHTQCTFVVPQLTANTILHLKSLFLLFICYVWINLPFGTLHFDGWDKKSYFNIRLTEYDFHCNLLLSIYVVRCHALACLKFITKNKRAGEIPCKISRCVSLFCNINLIIFCPYTFWIWSPYLARVICLIICYICILVFHIVMTFKHELFVFRLVCKQYC